MTHGDEETWDPDIQGLPVTGDGEVQPAPTAPRPEPAQQVHNPAPSQHGYVPQGFHGPVQTAPRQWQGMNQPHPQAPPPQHYNNQSRQSPRPPVPGHYRDVSILPWWAWAAIGVVTVGCGLLVLVAVSPAILDPNSTHGFNPALHEEYADMDVLTPGSTFTGTVDGVPWDVSITDENWEADSQVQLETSMPEPAQGMKYVGLNISAETTYANVNPVEEAFLFYYVTPAGQEYSQHFCSTGCLGDGSVSYRNFDGWIYFEVPDTIPEGGYLRVNLLYSGATDTLMELL